MENKYYIQVRCLIHATVFWCRHHVYKKSGAKDVELKEVGPRFEMKRMSG